MHNTLIYSFDCLVICTGLALQAVSECHSSSCVCFSQQFRAAVPYSRSAYPASVSEKMQPKIIQTLEDYTTPEKLCQLFSLTLLVQFSLEDNESSVLCY